MNCKVCELYLSKTGWDKGKHTSLILFKIKISNLPPPILYFSNGLWQDGFPILFITGLSAAITKWNSQSLLETSLLSRYGEVSLIGVLKSVDWLKVALMSDLR